MAEYLVLDVSKYNAISDYTAAAADVDGVLIRVGYRGYGSSGTLNTDSLFSTHYNGFQPTGTKIGYYWFTQATSNDEAIAEADYVYSLIKDLQCDFPIYIDSEYSNTDHDGRADSLSVTDRTTYLIAFCDRMIELGYRAGVYASDSWFISQLNWDTIASKNYSIWVASYSSQPSRVTRYDAWQYTSSGSISGYSGRVDLSRFYIDVAGWTTTTKTTLSNCTITADIPSATYWGGANKPNITIKNGETTLTQGTDYNLTYADNVNAGTALITATGIGDYDGAITLHFTIEPRSIAETGSITCGDADSNGYYDINNLAVSCDLGMMTKDVDYWISTSESTTDGYVYTNVSATGMNNYTGVVNKSFKTAKALIDISTITMSVSESYSYTGSPITPAINSSLTEGTDYTAEYSYNINIGTATIIITGIGDYTGTKTLQFNITTKDISTAIISCGEADNNGCYNIDNLSVVLDSQTLQNGIDYSVTISNTTGEKYIVTSVTVEGINNYTGSVSADFNTTKIFIDISTIDMSLDQTEYIYTGSEIIPNIISELTQGTDYTVEYSNNINIGIATAEIVGIGDYDGRKSLDFTIAAKDLSTATVTCGDPDVDGYYNIENLSVVIGSKELENTVDYSILISNTEIDDLHNTSVITITGIGNYTGTVEATFDTNKVDIDVNMVSMSINGDFYYNGSAIIAFVTSDLMVGIDYVTEYSNNVNVGTASVTITGIGNYTGTRVLEFEIQATDIKDGIVTCGDPDSTGSYDISNLTVTVDSRTLIKDTDYSIATEVTEENNYKVTKVTITGINNYTGTLEASFNTEKIYININSISMGIAGSYVYTGLEITPEITSDLTEGTDYTVEYSNNINAGTATAIITGIGDYNNTRTINFTIQAKDISTAEISCGEPNEEGCYDTSNPIVTFESLTLVEGTDYAITRINQKGESFDTTTITITGINNYSGEVSKTFNVLLVLTEISTVEMILDEDSFIYTGEAITPIIISDLEEKVDYTAVYVDNINAGTATIIIAGIGDYTGNRQLTFTINPKDISTAEISCGEPDSNGYYDLENLIVTFESRILELGIEYAKTITNSNVNGNNVATVKISGINNHSGEVSKSFATRKVDIDINTIDMKIMGTYTYTGSEIEPVIITELDKDTDYTVEYSNNINAGTATATITGIGDYIGTREINFTITSKGILQAVISCGEPDEEGCYDLDNLKVTLDSVILTRDTDYFVSISNKSVEGYNCSLITITGKKNYTGEISASFNTEKVLIDINSIDINFNPKSAIYTGDEIRPVILSDLKENVDYVVEYFDNINVGTGNIIVTGIGNYTGTRKFEFTIIPAEISRVDITCGESDNEGCYDIDNLSIVFNEKELVEDVDYTKTIMADSNETHKMVVIECTGIGNFTGKTSAAFNIELIDPDSEDDPDVPIIDPTNPNFNIGQKFILDNVKVYPRYCSPKSNLTKSGEFYIWNLSIVNNRIRITTNPLYVGISGQVVGWVDIDDLLDREEFEIGDQVIVSDNLTKYADGTGNQIVVSSNPMVIVDILDEAFKNNIGVASSLNRSRQGWTNKENIKKYIV